MTILWRAFVALNVYDKLIKMFSGLSLSKVLRLINDIVENRVVSSGMKWKKSPELSENIFLAEHIIVQRCA